MRLLVQSSAVFRRLSAHSAVSPTGLRVAGGDDPQLFKGDTLAIKNFGKITESIFRGAQPRNGEYWTLRSHGIRTVLDLQDSPEKWAKQRVEECNLKYISLPMSDSKRPGPEFPAAFFNIVNDRSLGPVYVHCRGGRHRTGLCAAIFRLEYQGWPLKKVMAEVESYDFGWLKWRWIGHQAIKHYIEDYALHMTREDAR